MALKFLFLLFLCALSAGLAPANSKEKKSDLVLPKPHKHVKSKAGKILVWPEDTKAFKEIRVRSLIVELNSNGLVLPMYADADSLCYVLQGRASAGVLRPSGESSNIRYVRTGDVVALPAGWTVWLWNTGRSEMKMFCVNKPFLQEDCRDCRGFFLAGGNKTGGGSVLRGFSDEVLSRMLELDMKEARTVVESQESSVLVQTENSLPNELEDEDSFMEGDLAFNMETARPEMIEAGGRMTLLDDTRMRVLEKLDFGAVLVRLNPFSMFAPQWLHGFGQIVYVTEGEGRVEVTDWNGEAVVNETLDAGNVFVVPPFHPHVVVNNGSSPMEWICIHFTSRFYTSFLAGAKSVYRSIPLELLAASFNTSEDVAEMLRMSREGEKMFFKLDRGTVLRSVV